MIHFVMPRDHDFTIREYIEGRGRDVAARCRIVHYEDLPDRDRLDPGVYAFLAADQLRDGVRRLAVAVERRLDAAGVTIFNRPSQALHRLSLLERLHREGRNDFRAVPAAGGLGGLRYPVFLRSATYHNGPLSALLASPHEVDAAIGRAVMGGYAAEDLLVIEFCDTSDAAGMFRKYSAFVVGHRVIARSLQYGHTWAIKHMAGSFSRAMHVEARDYVVQNPHAEALAAVFRLAGVEYGRIDYGFRNGRLQVWEINLNPSIGRSRGHRGAEMPGEISDLRGEINTHFYRSFGEAFAAVDQPGPAAPVTLLIDRALADAARSAMGVSWPPSETFWRRVGPLRPLLVPWMVPLWHALRRMGRVVSPLFAPTFAKIGRRARRTAPAP